MTTIEKLQGIFRMVFDDENLMLTRATTAADIEDWDSLMQINIIVACASEFDMRFDLSDVARLSDVGGMIDLIETKQSDSLSKGG